MLRMPVEPYLVEPEAELSVLGSCKSRTRSPAKPALRVRASKLYSVRCRNRLSLALPDPAVWQAAPLWIYTAESD